jgi:hypothetical protein
MCLLVTDRGWVISVMGIDLESDIKRWLMRIGGSGIGG